jgi:hypothetical protein
VVIGPTGLDPKHEIPFRRALAVLLNGPGDEIEQLLDGASKVIYFIENLVLNIV